MHGCGNVGWLLSSAECDGQVKRAALEVRGMEQHHRDRVLRTRESLVLSWCGATSAASEDSVRNDEILMSIESDSLHTFDRKATRSTPVKQMKPL